jgi:hypothetical protein
MYYWFKKYNAVKWYENKGTTAYDYYLINKRLKKIETENKILNECNCTSSTSRKNKLEAIAILDEKYKYSE